MQIRPSVQCINVVRDDNFKVHFRMGSLGLTFSLGIHYEAASEPSVFGAIKIGGIFISQLYHPSVPFDIQPHSSCQAESIIIGI